MSSKQSIIGGVFLLVLIIGGSVWLAQPGPTSPQSTVKLGVIAGTTGDYAAAGEAYVKGFELAREQWDSSHSLQFTDVIEDDGFNAQKGVAAYTKLKTVDHPDSYAVLSSFTIDAIVNDLHKEAKPVALGFNQGIPAQDDNIFQVLPAERITEQALGAHLKELGYKNPVLIVSNNSPVQETFADGFRDGYGVAEEEQITGDKLAVSAEVTRVLARKPDVVVFFTDPPIGALMAKNIILQSGDHKPQLAFDQSVQSGIQDYKAMFGDDLHDLDGSMVAVSSNDLTDAFKTAFKNKYGIDAPFGADMGYNAFMLLATTYDPNPTVWTQHMKSAKFPGADGTISFNEVGLRVPNPVFCELKKGEVVCGE